MSVGDLPEKTRRHLELEYSYDPSPDDKIKAALAQLTGLATKGVEEWFETQRRQDATYRQPTDQSHVVTLSSHSDEQSRPPKRRTSVTGDRQAPGLELNRGLIREQLERNKEAKSLSACVGDYEEDRSQHFTSKRVYPEDNDLTRRVSPDTRDDYPRRLEPSSTESQARIPDGNTTSAPAWEILQYSSSNKVATKEAYSKDRGDGEDESNLPGYMVFTSMGERVRKRRRRAFDGSRRKEVAQVRKVGACAACRLKKTRVSQSNFLVKIPIILTTLRCVHALEADRLPLNDTSVSSVARSPVVFPFAEPEVFNIIEPMTESSELPNVVPGRSSSASSMSTPPSALIQSAISPSFSTLAVSTSDDSTPLQPVLISQPSNETGQQDINWPDAISKKAASLAPPLSPKSDSCPNCGFKPEGDPKWHKSNLARHIRVLHSGKPYLFECTSPGCGRNFHRSDNLRAHWRKAHDRSMDAEPSLAVRDGDVVKDDSEFVAEARSGYGPRNEAGKAAAGDGVVEGRGEEGLERRNEIVDENESGNGKSSRLPVEKGQPFIISEETRRVANEFMNEEEIGSAAHGESQTRKYATD